jgi:hypothetical protein
MSCQPLLANAQLATYGASVRAGGMAHGKLIAVLAIHFDRECWPAPLSRACASVRLTKRACSWSMPISE